MLKNIIQSLLTKGMVAAINFFILILSSKFLGVSSRGEISIFILNISIIQAINEIYTGYSIIHFIPKFNLKKIVVHGLLFTFIFTALINGVLAFLGKQVPGYEWFGYLASVLVILNTFNCIILLGRENIFMFNLLSVLQPLLLLAGIGFFTLVLNIYTFAAYLYPLLFSFALAILVSGSYVGNYLLAPSVNKAYSLVSVLSGGVAFQAGLLLFIFCNRIGYYLLPGKASVGLYSAAVTLTESVLVIANGLAPVILSKVANRNNGEQNAAMSLSVGKFIFLASLLAMVLVVSLPETVYILILGQGFAGIREVILIYSPGVLALSIMIPLAGYYSAGGRQKTVLLAYFFGFAVNLPAAYWLIRHHHVKGAALTANLSYFAMTVYLFARFVREHKIKPRQVFSISGDYQNVRALLRL